MDRNIEAGLFELCSGPRRKSRRAAHAAWTTEPTVGRVVDGLAARVDRLKAIGNGQVPLVAATAFAILSERIMMTSTLNRG